MEMIADALLIAGAGAAALYCRVLAGRLQALKNLDSGLGAAIAGLSRQVDEMKVSLDAAKAVSGDQSRSLSQLTSRAEMAAGRLELLLAALHENGRQRPLNLRRDPAEALRAAAEASAREAERERDDEQAADAARVAETLALHERRAAAS
jgi:hypothetical protein